MGKSSEKLIQALDEAIARGLDDADAGRTQDAQQVFDRLEMEFREKASQQSRAVANDPQDAEDQRFLDGLSEF